MSTEERPEPPRERLLAEVYAQPEPEPGCALAPGARDRARAVERFMQAREAREASLRRHRVYPRGLARAAALAVCALSASLAWNAWLEPRSAQRAMSVQAPRARAVLAESAPPLEPARLIAAPESAPSPVVAEKPAARVRETVEPLPAARRRAPRAQDVPVAIRAFGAAELESLRASEVEEIAIGQSDGPLLSFDGRPPESEPRAAEVPAARGDLASPITLAPLSAERVRELAAQRGNDIAEVLPALGAETVDPCAKPERVGAAVPPGTSGAAERADARCPSASR